MNRILCLCLLAACDPVPPRSMSDVDLPAGFRLDTTSQVAVRVDVGDAPVGGRLTLKTPTEQVLYEGSLDLAARAGVVVRVPAGTDTLVALVDLQDGAPWVTDVAVHDQEARLVVGR